MPRFELHVEDGRRRLLAVVAGIAAALAAAPPAHADLASRPAHRATHVDRADHGRPGPLALVDALRARFAALPGRVSGWSQPGTAPAMPLLLSRTWSLDLAMRPTPPAQLALLLTGSVHQVLSWIVPPQTARERALDEILEGIAVEPVSGAETSSYGYRSDPFTHRRKLHKGVDYQAPRGTPVRAAGPGVIRVARRKRGYGRVVMIDHGAGVQTRYAHLQRIAVEPGERVAPGMLIGTVGSTGRATGPHLHFELRIDGEAYDPEQVLGPLAPLERVARER